MMLSQHMPGQSWGANSSAASLYASTSTDDIGRQRTQQPITTGTSVLGIKYNGGVLLAADTLASYGSLAKYDNISRLHKIGDKICMAAGGDLSDFQYLQELVDAKMREEEIAQDAHSLTPRQVFEWLSRIMYARRSKVDPLWNTILLAGVDGTEPFLSYVDLQGTTYTSPSLATGFGAHIAQPILRKALEGRNPSAISKDEAERVLVDCMKVLFYRDARSINKFQIATVTAEGVDISAPRSAETVWDFADKIRGYGPQEQ